MGSPATAIEFVMHPDLLRSVIKRQAGTLAKAALEGVMNSIDAGATEVFVTLNENRIVIKDDGCGFAGREEIDLFFKTFGQPHEEGDAIYGKFRMGRGQMFAFGKNVWRTGCFQMNVDIDQRLGFDLIEDLPYEKGCHITIDLYRPLVTWEYNSIIREIEQYVKYTNIPVYINGKQINRIPTVKEFPDTIDDAFIKLDAGVHGIQIYNLGVFVQTIPSSQFGCGGVIVSRKQMTVNFARNMVMINECPVWSKVKPIINKRGRELVIKKPTLNDSERVNAIERVIVGDVNYDDIKSLKIFVDVTGKAWSVNMITRGGFAYWSYAKKGDGQADLMIQQGVALVLDEQWLKLFELNDLSQVFEQYARSVNLSKYKAFTELRKTERDDYFTVPKKEWTARERVWLALLSHVSYEYSKRTRNGDWVRERTLLIGKSNSANAWTDGRSEIVFNRAYLAEHPLMNNVGIVDLSSVTRVFLTWIHEMNHDLSSIENVHSPEFYQGFHDDCMKALGRMVEVAMSWMTKERYSNMMEKAKKKNAGLQSADDCD